MAGKKKPISIENRWDILYRDYPEVYDKFSSFKYSPTWHEVLNKKFNFKNKVIADIGSGSGKSTFGLAKYSKYVIGIEPEDAMRKLAIKNAKKIGVKNIEFKKGELKKMPLEKNSVDAVVGVTTVGIHTLKEMKDFIKEASRVIKPKGYIMMLNIAPGCYGGDLNPHILDTGHHYDKKIDDMYIKLGFKKKDIYSLQDYKTTKNMIDTYGFIFGEKIINYIKENNISKVKWKLRVRYKKVTSWQEKKLRSKE